ncbi:DUF5060 domain-containing protein [bacterium]|nr:DUF5060 domain-containing protein [bacterium]
MKAFQIPMFVLLGLVAAIVSEAAVQVEEYHVHELTLRGSKDHPNDFMVDVSAIFDGPNGEKLTIPGFYDGKNAWKVRFSPVSVGEWRYTTHCEADVGLHGKRGTIECIPNTSSNIHGGLKIDPDHPRHFIYEDGTRYFLLGFEADWIWALDMSDPAIPNLRKFVDAIAAHGFNHIVMNAYAHDTSWAKGKSNPWDYGPPEMYAWKGTNQKPDHSRMNLRFWRHYDRVISCLQEKGITAHIMLRVYNKMVNWPKNGSPEDDLYYKYIVARYQAFSNVTWDFSKEAHNEKDAQYKLAVIKATKKLDAYDRLVTVHDDNRNYDNGNYNICDFRSDQQHSKWGETILAQRKARTWPVVNIEYGYERGVDKLPTYGVMQDWQEVLRRTYEVICAGGYPNYYYSNTSWGLIKWEPQPPGWKRYRILKDFFDGVNYWQMAPKGRANGTWVLANEGKEYVIFAPKGGTVRFTVSLAASPLRSEWLNIYTGEKVPAGAVSNGDHAKKSPFGSQPVLLHLEGSNGPVPILSPPKQTPVATERLLRYYSAGWKEAKA